MLAGWQQRMVVSALLLGAYLGSAAQDLSWWKSPMQRTHPAKQQRTLVDVNEASVEDLMKVPGMSRVWAMRIVRFRPYSNKYALKLEGVLPGNVYERLKPYLVAHREK
jgi:competence protein ComEA